MGLSSPAALLSITLCSLCTPPWITGIAPHTHLQLRPHPMGSPGGWEVLWGHRGWADGRCPSSFRSCTAEEGKQMLFSSQRL